MDLETDLLMIKACLRAVLQSEREYIEHGLRRKNLEWEYKKEEGRLDYKKFGCSTFLQFLTEKCRDACRVKLDTGNEDDFLVFPVSDKNTRHMEDMQLKTKKKKKKKVGMKKTFMVKAKKFVSSYSRPYHTYQPTTVKPYKPLVKPTVKPTAKTWQPPVKDKLKLTSSSWQVYGAYVKGILLDRKAGMMSSDVERSFEKKFRERLPSDWVDQLEYRFIQICKDFGDEMYLVKNLPEKVNTEKTSGQSSSPSLSTPSISVVPTSSTTSSFKTSSARASAATSVRSTVSSAPISNPSSASSNTPGRSCTTTSVSSKAAPVRPTIPIKGISATIMPVRPPSSLSAPLRRVRPSMPLFQVRCVTPTNLSMLTPVWSVSPPTNLPILTPVRCVRPPTTPSVSAPVRSARQTTPYIRAPVRSMRPVTPSTSVVRPISSTSPSIPSPVKSGRPIISMTSSLVRSVVPSTPTISSPVKSRPVFSMISAPARSDKTSTLLESALAKSSTLVSTTMNVADKSLDQQEDKDVIQLKSSTSIKPAEKVSAEILLDASTETIDIIDDSDGDNHQSNDVNANNIRRAITIRRGSMNSRELATRPRPSIVKYHHPNSKSHVPLSFNKRTKDKTNLCTQKSKQIEKPVLLDDELSDKQPTSDRMNTNNNNNNREDIEIYFSDSESEVEENEKFECTCNSTATPAFCLTCAAFFPRDNILCQAHPENMTLCSFCLSTEVIQLEESKY